MKHGLHVVAAALLLYVVIAPSTILGGDNAEFSTLLATGGVAHPSGYPLYVLYLRAFAWLPVPPAHAAAIATALLGALQCGLLHAAARAWGARPGAAAIAVAIYAGGPLPLLLHTQAEVFALNGVIVAAILLVAADGGPRRGLARVATLGLLAGLGMSNHLSCVLVAPVGVIGAVRGARESGRIGAAIALGAGALAVGLLPYVYLLVTSGGWGGVDSAGALVDHALRRDYGTFSLGAGGVPVSRGDQLGALAASIGRGWWYLPLAAAAWGFYVGIARPTEGRGRAAWIGLAVALVLAGPAFALASNVPLRGLGRAIVERFHLLPVLLLVVPVARGLTPVFAWIDSSRHSLSREVEERRSSVPGVLDEHATKRSRDRRSLAGQDRRTLGSDALTDRVPPRVLLVLPVAVLVACAAASWPRVRAAEGPQVELFLRNTLAILPEDAVLLGTGDHQGFGFPYLQRARGVRPDVTYLDLELMAWPWYRARADARLGFRTAPTSTALVGQLLEHDCVVFLDGPGTQRSEQGQIVGAVTVYPWGTVVRVLPRGERAPRIDQLEEDNAALLAKMTPRGPRPARGDGWAALVYGRYAAPWQSIARAYESVGRAEDAARAAAIAEQLLPQQP